MSKPRRIESDGPVRVAIYTRVSTKDQANEGYSLDAQLERLRAHCKGQGWEIAGEYVDDGYSGRKTDRPAYDRMMDEMDRWDTLLVVKMDRIHRNSRNFMAMMDTLAAKGKEFASTTESLDTRTAMGRFVMDIIQRIAQLESEQIGERSYVGMEQKAKEGKGSLGGPAPYGYRNADGVLVPVDTELAVAEAIFKMFLRGDSLGSIARELNKRRVPTKKGGGKWSPWVVSKIIDNPTYAGFIEWEGITQPHAAKVAVDLETYNRVRKKRGRSPVGTSP